MKPATDAVDLARIWRAAYAKWERGETSSPSPFDLVTAAQCAMHHRCDDIGAAWLAEEISDRLGTDSLETVARFVVHAFNQDEGLA